MHKEDYPESLHDALAGEDDIEEILVFYKDEEELELKSSEDAGDDKNYVVEDDDQEANAISIETAVNTDDNNNIDTVSIITKETGVFVRKVKETSTISQMLHFPSGRKINIINPK
ncbi:hypothetical protein [Desulfosporosinus youngiae]|uniref:Uncharacterized protein n=1 Tax=Desulfosporosinus youngiae DSM 17734 TaxID=768710 RepID=H5XUQ9_9FIRM|nr:hypothetical protein [Desulfosporosinus youngiae]EHQ89216.1 hypothetical protein DesyoDRAFT_2129 [Desulfosporosinus youngiae DSM 17734]